MKTLITGIAGFIGYHLTKRLAEENCEITCIDNINDYYDVDLKYGRLAALGFDKKSIEESGTSDYITSSHFSNVRFVKMDLIDAGRIMSLFRDNIFECVLHLAAQAGVRYSLTNPEVYVSSNVQGFLNILEAAKLFPPKHLVYASSSSIYGLNSKIPFSENDAVNMPASLYAATKRSNELMAHTYSHLYHIPTTGLRFFTVYGPWGRPDMAPFIFTKSIIEGTPINVFNNGNMKRDFTFVDDIVEGIVRVVNHVPHETDEAPVPAVIYNIGNGGPVQLMDFIHSIEETLKKKAEIVYKPMQAGDVIATWADCSALERVTGFRPNTPLSTGIEKFIEWYKAYYHHEHH